jgi:hypothetical protein
MPRKRERDAPRVVYRTARCGLRVTRGQRNRLFGLLRSAGDVWCAVLELNSWRRARQEIWRTRDGHMRVQLANVLFPYPAVSPDVLARIEEFLAGPGDPGIVRVLIDHYDTAQRALRLRSLPP